MSRPVHLEGIVEVMHVTHRGSGEGFGIGCRVRSYRVLPSVNLQAPNEIRAVLSQPYSLEDGGPETSAELPFAWHVSNV